MGEPAIPNNLTDEELLKLTLTADDQDIEADAVLLLDGRPLPAEDAS